MKTGLLDRGITEEQLEEMLERTEREDDMGKSQNLDNSSDTDVFCPFYKGTENQQVIRCEGPYDQTAVRIGFAGKKKCKSFMDRYCNTKYCEECRMYRCIMTKYSDT